MADAHTVMTRVPVLVNISTSTSSTAAQLAAVINWLTFAIGLPALGLAIYALRNLTHGVWTL